MDKTSKQIGTTEAIGQFNFLEKYLSRHSIRAEKVNAK